MSTPKPVTNTEARAATSKLPSKIRNQAEWLVAPTKLDALQV